MKSMGNEAKMIVILCSEIMLLSAHARHWELLIKFEATRTGAPHRLTVATSINNNKYKYV